MAERRFSIGTPVTTSCLGERKGREREKKRERRGEGGKREKEIEEREKREGGRKEGE